MKKNYLIVIEADDAKGLLNRITGIFCRARLPIESLLTARTDIHGVVKIFIETELEADQAEIFAMKIEKIVEVDTVQLIEERPHLQKAYFSLSSNFTNWTVIREKGASVVDINNERVLVEKSGTGDEIQRLYNALDGVMLLDFYRFGVASLV